MRTGTLYMIPCGLGGETLSDIVPAEVLEKVVQMRHFIVEDVKSARRFLRKADRNFPIDESHFHVLNKKTDRGEIYFFLKALAAGEDMGVLSEAGCPGVADPGAEVVAVAHSMNARIHPFVGPSSVLLTLMGSGFSGQQFTFHGYLSKDRKDRVKQLKDFEHDTRRSGATHLFMDTPFRNMHVLEDLLNELSDATMLCIASNVTLPDQSIRSMSIKDWREHAYDLAKKPTMFAIGSLQ